MASEPAAIRVTRIGLGAHDEISVKGVLDGRRTHCQFVEYNRDGLLEYAPVWVNISSPSGRSTMSCRRHAKRVCDVPGKPTTFDRLFARWLQLVAPELREDCEDHRLVIDVLSRILGPLDTMRLLAG